MGVHVFAVGWRESPERRVLEVQGGADALAVHLQAVNKLKLQPLWPASDLAERALVVRRVVAGRAILPPDLAAPIDRARAN
eukprot:COSAG03_NODE_15705_length_423_cov_0.530864_1_plen_80_part_01